APWRAQVAELAVRGAPEAQTLLRNADSAFAALERSVLSQRTDAWDVYAAPLDVVRRKLFAVDRTVMRTVDELWVRIFPDDVAVRFARRARFAPERDERHAELDARRQKLADLETGARGMPTVDPHDPAVRRAMMALAAVPTKPGPWTQAPHAPVLPERFVV